MQVAEENHVDMNVYRYVNSKLDVTRSDNAIIYFGTSSRGRYRMHGGRTSTLKVGISTFKCIAFLPVFLVYDGWKFFLFYLSYSGRTVS